MERARAQIEAHFMYRLQTVGGFGGKSDQLNGYNMVVADPGYFDTDLARYRDVTVDGIRGVVGRHVTRARRVAVSAVPRGSAQVALAGSVGAMVS